MRTATIDKQLQQVQLRLSKARPNQRPALLKRAEALQLELLRLEIKRHEIAHEEDQ